jgi:hypothetical protein
VKCTIKYSENEGEGQTRSDHPAEFASSSRVE